MGFPLSGISMYLNLDNAAQNQPNEKQMTQKGQIDVNGS